MVRSTLAASVDDDGALCGLDSTCTHSSAHCEDMEDSSSTSTHLASNPNRSLGSGTCLRTLLTAHCEHVEDSSNTSTHSAFNSSRSIASRTCVIGLASQTSFSVERTQIPTTKNLLRLLSVYFITTGPPLCPGSIEPPIFRKPLLASKFEIFACIGWGALQTGPLWPYPAKTACAPNSASAKGQVLSCGISGTRASCSRAMSSPPDLLSTMRLLLFNQCSGMI
mmetsp:Transcript_43543/g.105708  ORF Transcript_43543/g.105708 Transcript_43543/m.105708 type:complete len:223 (-) Transcript_43543:515-1183(-)